MRLFCLCLAMVTIAGCKMNDAMDSANQIPTRMDQTNKKIDDTNAKLDTTAEAIRLQKLAIAKENLEDPKNGEYLAPFPAALVAYAKTFAETGTEDELVGQIYLYVTEINKGVGTEKLAADGTLIALSPQDNQDINHYKQQRLTAAEAICGFIPQTMIDEIVKTEIIGEGRYKDTALTILMFRFKFLGEILLDKSLLDDQITSVGVLEKALEYSKYMEIIAEYPFAAYVKSDITGISGVPETVETLQGASQAILDRLNAIDLQVTINLSLDDVQTFDVNPKVSAQLQAEAQKRLDTANSDLQRRIAYWTARAAQTPQP